MQGVDVALVERDDFVSGASAASSHMIHGGIRYLENGEFRLVHEAVTERNALLRIAPHYVRPLQTTIPIFSTFSGVLSAPLRFLRHGGGKHTERGAALIKIGLVIYDSFSRGGGQVRASHVPRAQALAAGSAPAEPRRQVHRHVLGRLAARPRTARDRRAARRPRGRRRQRARGELHRRGRRRRRARRAARHGIRSRSCRSRHPSSSTRPGRGPTSPTSRSATPPITWAAPRARTSSSTTPSCSTATGGRELFFENADGRIVLIYPLKGRVLVGTTDLEHTMGEPIVCTEAEVDYFIDLIGQVLPRIAVDRSQIVYRFSGVRPLPGHGDVAPGFVSRDYRIESAPLVGSSDTTVLSLVGGKWTTFRASAENLADHALERPRGPAATLDQGHPDRRRSRLSRHRARPSAVDRHPRRRARPGAGRDAARPLRHGRRGCHRGDRRRPRRRAPRVASRLQHAASCATSRARSRSCTSTTCCCGARVSPSSAPSRRSPRGEIAAAIAPVMEWDAERCRSEVERALAKVHAADPTLDGRGIRRESRVAIA